MAKNKTHRRKAWYLGKYLSVFIALVFVFGMTFSAKADNPISDQIKITGQVNGPAPSIASVIESPADGDVVTTNPVLINGRCPSRGLIINIFNNGHFIGSDFCRSDLSFTLYADLFFGKNILIAEEVDSLGRHGPDSTPITVYFKPNTTTPTTQNSQLSIIFDPTFSGYTSCGAGQQLNLPFRVSGGTSPYEINVEWGDGSTQLARLANSKTPLIGSHTYLEAGNYQIKVKATDQDGQKATLQIAIIIDGKANSPAAVIGTTARNITRLPPAYYVLAGSLLILGYFIGKLTRKQRVSGQIFKPNN